MWNPHTTTVARVYVLHGVCSGHTLHEATEVRLLATIVLPFGITFTLHGVRHATDKLSAVRNLVSLALCEYKYLFVRRNNFVKYVFASVSV